MIPKKEVSQPHPSICPTHCTRRCQPAPAPAREECADPPRGSSGQAGLGGGEAAETTTGWQGLKRPAQAHQPGSPSWSQTQRGLPTPHPSLTMRPSLLLVWAPGSPASPCRSDRTMAKVSRPAERCCMGHSAPLRVSWPVRSTYPGRVAQSQVSTHEMVRAIASPSASWGSAS